MAWQSQTGKERSKKMNLLMSVKEGDAVSEISVRIFGNDEMTDEQSHLMMQGLLGTYRSIAQKCGFTKLQTLEYAVENIADEEHIFQYRPESMN
jgi:hypothetical protein